MAKPPVSFTLDYAPLWPQVRYQLLHLLPLFAAGVALLFFMPFLPLGKNLDELISQSHLLGLSAAVVSALYLTFVFPISLLRANLGFGKMLMLLLASHLLLWLLLSSQVAAESLFDILGTPVLNWPWETELLMRFLAWLWLVQLCWLLTTRQASSKWLWIGISPFVFAASYTVIIPLAATDNITELLRQPFGLVGIIATFLVMFAASEQLSLAKPLGQRVLIYLITWLVSFALLAISTQSEVDKYGHQFAALSFMLGLGRQQTTSMVLLLGVSLLPYIVIMMALVQLRKFARQTAPSLAPQGTDHEEISVQPVNRANNSQHASTQSHGIHISSWPLILYAILIAYGTLYPFDQWQSLALPAIWSVLTSAPSGLSSTDILVNSLIYLPFGFMLHQHLYSSVGKRHLWVLLWAFLLSYCLEYLQFFLPERNTSQLDLLLNTLGGGLGSLLAARYHPDSDYLSRLNAWRAQYIISSPSALLGLASLAALLIGYFSPLQPNLSPYGVWQAIKPLWQPQLYDFSAFKLLSYFLQHLIMGLILRAVLHADKRYWAWLLPLLLTFIHPFILFHQLSLDLMLGSVLASIALLFASLNRQTSERQYSVIAFITLAWLLIKALLPASGDIHPFNWSPFFYQLQNLAFASSMFNAVWPVFALAFCAMQGHANWFIKRELICALAIGLLFIALEVLQIGQPGRYPDITDAIIAAISWIFIVHFYRNHYAHQQGHNKEPAYLPYWPIAVFSLCLLFIGTLLSIHQFSQPSVQASPINAALDYKLPQFNATRPRLPAPSNEDIKALSQDGYYLSELKTRSKRGKLDSQAILAYLQPEQVDLTQLHQDLMALEFRGRGNVEVKPLAVAYDWLYPRWSQAQRAELQGKLLQGCQFIIDYISKAQLSPYNVYLYNSPLQALMACAIAGYQDAPEFEPVMAFTAYTWREQVLPVWRQVMGQHGGWHEGAEYVGIGIGQGIYQLPAMWRKATSEDFFNEPGIVGFADFLLYRIRPDLSQMRWGDGRFFDRGIPDQLALAIELNHQASLTRLRNKHLGPTSWPWGPLMGDLTPAAKPAPLPWAKWFDGIGHLVARSDESPNATYVNFRAGNNYWSHQHLDQGSFTLYKGSPLAIDSGYYGPGYGADHHLNYSYQTIAHNTLTITDPDDNQAMPAKKAGQAEREIANDGGQRRIGSGWGQAAPTSVAQWQQQVDTFHTATVLEQVQTESLVAIYADLTPAYQNQMSGKGDFSARSQRVDKVKRLFIYDKQLDVAIVYDQVTSRQADFTKRWLLHSIGQPTRQADGQWLIQTPAQSERQQPGQLWFIPLLPQQHQVLDIGGPGFEFFVDGVNYDENGKLNTIVQKQRQPKPELGQWRLELIPEQPQTEDEFLVLLKPELAGLSNQTQHSFSQQGGQHRLTLRIADYQLSLLITPEQIQLQQISGTTPSPPWLWAK
ncbi:VanZ family protein [Motilimonas eburnea]|uniref:VanZ family protein n=1 Tax=Motilimonas eburnea TaxID=1737488 RepID=UPI001E2C4D4A|nr:VanZ family protein [Motilimonas eburnea]MCE2572212.1 VanZ family protein [Motilimonas eburnea]